MSKSQRTKGAAGEREVVNIIRDTLGLEVFRNLNQTREGGCDINLPPFCVEVKRRARIGQVYDWIRQAEDACHLGERPVVIARADGKGWLAIQPLNQWLSQIREEAVEYSPDNIGNAGLTDGESQ